MEPQEQNDQNQRTRLVSYLRQNWVIIFAFITIITIIYLLIILGNSRYEAGYKAGAGTGAVYEPLYRQAQTDLDNLRKQHEKDIEQIADLNRKLSKAESKNGLLKPAITQRQADDSVDAARKLQDEVNQETLRTLRESREIGETFGRLKEIEKSNQKLMEDNDNLQFGINLRNIIILVFFIIGVVIWLDSRKIDTYSPVYPMPRIANIYPDTNKGSVQINADSDQGYLPEKSENNSENDDVESL